jgi:hypothetical protein
LRDKTHPLSDFKIVRDDLNNTPLNLSLPMKIVMPDLLTKVFINKAITPVAAASIAVRFLPKIKQSNGDGATK